MPQAKSAAQTMRKTNFAFAALLIGMIAYFIVWGLGYTNHNHVVLFLLATLFGVFMAFNIGGNDVANSFGTSVGAGTLTVPQALLIAAVFEVSGAVIAGGEVTHTIRNGIVDLGGLGIQPMDLVYIMMSALLAAALWLLYASKKGLPVSTTHAIIGGIVGSSLALGFMISRPGESPWQMVQWSKIGSIAVSWVLSPLLGGVVAYVLFGFLKKYVLDYNEKVESQLKELKARKKAYKEQHQQKFELLSEQEKVAAADAMAHDAELASEDDFNPDDFKSEYYKGLNEFSIEKSGIEHNKALYTWVPVAAAVAGVMMSSLLIFKGLKNLHLDLSPIVSTMLIMLISASLWLATFIYAKGLKRKNIAKSTFQLFSWLQVLTAAGFAFSHGANDISNAIGPFVAIMDVLRTNAIESSSSVPPEAMLTFGVALIVGLWFIGKEVIQTVGSGLAKLHPSSGFSAELAAASVVMGATVFGLPVSSTHILVGAILGIGLVNKNANWGMMKPIGLAWVITLPAASVLAVVSFLVLRGIFA